MSVNMVVHSIVFSLFCAICMIPQPWAGCVCWMERSARSFPAGEGVSVNETLYKRRVRRVDSQ